jgi:hypothetical protein
MLDVSTKVPATALGMGTNMVPSWDLPVHDVAISDAAPRHLSKRSGRTAAIYTNKGKPVHIISKVELLMKKGAHLGAKQSCLARASVPRGETYLDRK